MRTFEIYLAFTITALGTLLSTCSGYEANKFINDMISLHNTTRELHSADGLEWDFQMSIDAMKCLKAMHFDEFPSDGTFACNNDYHHTFYHSQTGEEDTATKVFSAWYIQGNDYDYTIDPTMNDQINDSSGQAAFTQIVWKNTKKFGLAVVQEKGENFVVATYYPPGNIAGKFLKNVGRPKIEVSSS